MEKIDKGMPQIGMRFRKPDEAWLFWVAYGGRVGFDVRKRNKHVSKMDGQVTSCKFVCSNEGTRKKGITIDHEPKRVRAETRTNCKTRMIISLDRVAMNYEVTDVVLEHNHYLQLPQTCHLMASQRKISEVQAFEIEAAEDSGIMPQAAHELACRRVNGPFNLAIGSLHGDLEFEEERIVIGDPLTKTASCSCGMFNRTGILCGHGLKVLDLMNIKTLPTHYVLKRWTREARNGSIQDRHGRNVVENPKFEAQFWYRGVSHKFHTMAAKVANSPECRLILEDALDCVSPQLDEKLNATMNATNKPCDDQENVDPNVQLTSEFLAAKFKKKEVQSKNFRRKRGWLDKLLKGRKLTKKKAAKQQKKNDGAQPQVRVEKDDGVQPQANVEVQESNTVISYTQLLMAPPGGVDDEDLF